MHEASDLVAETRETFLQEAGKIGLLQAFNIKEDYLLGTGRFFGDLWGVYLSEIMGITNRDTVIKLGTSCLFGRAYVIAQDQVLDGHSSFPIGYDGLVDSLLKTFIQLNFGMVSDYTFEHELQLKLDEYYAANIREQRQHNRQIVPYTLDDLSSIAKKTSIAQVPALAAAYISGKPEHAAGLCVATDKLLVAIQICDDLADIVEDFRLGNYTIPVTHGLLLCGSEERNLKNIYKGLMFSGLFESLILNAVENIGSTRDLVHEIAPGGTGAEDYFRSFGRYLCNILDEFTRIKRSKGFDMPLIADFTLLKQAAEADTGLLSALTPYLHKIEPAELAPKKLIC